MAFMRISFLVCWLSLVTSTIAYNHNATETPHDETLKDKYYLNIKMGGFKVFYDEPAVYQSVLLFVNETLGLSNFSIAIKSSRPTVSLVLPESIDVTKCNKNASLLNTSQEFTNNSSSFADWECYNITFIATGSWLGYSTFNFSLITGDEETYVDHALLTCLHKSRIIDVIFTVVIRALVILSTFGMGNGMEWEVIKGHMKKPKAPLVALASQYIIMPLLGYSVVFMMDYKGGLALGIFLMGISPGGGNSNMYARLLDGDMSLSITMTTLSTLASFGLLPLWLYTLGQTLPANDEVGRVAIPFLDIFISLITVIIPLIIGYVIKLKLPRVTKIIQKSLKVVFIIILLFVLTVGIYANLHVFRGFTFLTVFSSASLPYGGFLFGGIFAWICRLNWKLIKTVSLETGIQNIGIPILILQSSLPSPDSDLALMPVIAASMMTGLPLYVITPSYLIWKRCTKKKEVKEADMKDGDLSEPEVKELSELNADPSETQKLNPSEDENQNLQRDGEA